ncbi:uncharacterized protein KLLA0_F19965g [Kluyveromyces lactis]|uniref:KLLA0F19965p n=1 Tax=Kluyveromyces lactis (strain ATCC 8585 / CBS 2359 / DSM 70799 / NBRC 1267 / NRRL Y-1140 / WM37) TaxID=284590 RepID=Q6CJB2_KLULA|nr:uncharacterized protein KLLA0_F19965g [Kluyveromyces lactis]CAG98685.1 KLLA0F19965p [Kluyveromyces lactis]|eukprot:XP_455977.1 uncharacterized protein KLLA0_F19965g [Kluyveromyces lactis]
MDIVDTSEALINIPELLAHENIYQIQVGSKLFKVSGASLSSDGPSFFTDYFNSQENADASHVLTIDRSDVVFETIMAHLQGYPLSILDEKEFITLFLDSLYYRLPRLKRMLQKYDYYFINIGGKHFKFSKSVFDRPGDSPNYFNLLIDSMLVDVENLFHDKKMIRPPSHFIPFVTRSSELFQEILNLLTDDDYVVPGHISINNLLRECKFYCLLNLQQRLLPHKITSNPFCKREEITMKLQHLRRTGMKLLMQSEDINECIIRSDSESEESAFCPKKKRKMESPAEWDMISYQRPYVDKNPRDLVVQIDSGDLTLYFNKRMKTIHVNVANPLDCRILKSLFTDIRKQRNINESQFEYPNFKGYVFLTCTIIADLTINGLPCKNVCSKIDEIKTNEQIYDFSNGDGMMPGLSLYVVGPSLWRLGVKNEHIIFLPLKLNCISNLRQFNKNLQFV